MASVADFIRKAWHVPLLLAAAALCCNPDLFLHPARMREMQAFSAGSCAFLALAFLLFDFRRTVAALSAMKRGALLALGVFFCIASGHFLLNGRYPFEALGESLAWILLPLTAYVYADVFLLFLPRFLALLGLADLIVSGIQFHSGRLVFGITGNTNWNAMLLLVTLIFLLRELMLLTRRARIPVLLAYPLLGVLSAYGIGMFAACASRGASLALGLTGLVFLYLHLRPRGRRIFRYVFLGAVLCALLAALGPASGLVRRIAQQEDRLVFYKATLWLIAENPAFGVGGVSFEDEFVRFKPEDYFTRMRNATRTNHPHNDILFMAASFGIAGWIAWAWLLLYPLFTLFRRGMAELSGGRKAFLFAFLCLLFHAQLDLIFVAWPLNLTAFFLLGLLWRETLGEDAPAGELEHVWAFYAFAVPAGILILCWTGLSVSRSAYASFTAEAIRAPGMTRSEKLARIRRSLRFGPHEYKANYALMIAADKLGAPALALAAADALAGSYIGNYAHLHGYRGGALMKLGRYDEAFDAYLKEAENYPLSMIPVYNLAVISRLSGHPERIPGIEEELRRRMKIQNVTPALLAVILKNPQYDRAPWDIPVKYGGSGGYPGSR